MTTTGTSNFQAKIKASCEGRQTSLTEILLVPLQNTLLFLASLSLKSEAWFSLRFPSQESSFHFPLSLIKTFFGKPIAEDYLHC